jgi:hypothetical protein
MEQREARVIFNKSGGTAGKNSTTARITIPNAWIKQLGITAEHRTVVIGLLDENKIIIERK